MDVLTTTKDALFGQGAAQVLDRLAHLGAHGVVQLVALSMTVPDLSGLVMRRGLPGA